MVKIVQAATYHEGMERIIDLIKARQVDLEQNHILVVPDRFTFEAEQRLIKGSSGVFDVEVMTLSRLAKQHCKAAKYLSRQGAVAAITEILRENSAELSLYGSVYLRKGFSESVLNTLSQFKSCRLNPSDIDGGQGALLLKTADLRFIYQKYQDYLKATGFIDSADIINALNDYYKTADLSSTHFYFCNFHSMTTQTYGILQTLSQRANSLAVAVVYDETNPYLYDVSHMDALAYAFNGSFTVHKNPPSPFGLLSYALNAYKPQPHKFDNQAPITIYSAKNAVGEWIRVAREIRKRVVLNKMRYREIGVMVNSAEIDIIERVFGSFDIPFYAEKKFSLADHAIWDFVRGAINLADKGMEKNAVLALSKNAFFGGDKEALDCFESYVIEHGISYNGFLSPFEQDNEISIMGEQIRKRLIDLILPLKAQLRRSDYALGYAKVIENLLVGVDAEARLLAKEDSLQAQIYERLILSLHQLSDALQKQLPLIDYMAALDEALRACEISLIPLLSDCVLIGAPEMFISDPKKLLFVVGASEARLPQIKQDFGIFSDRDLSELKQSASLDITPKISFVNDEARIKTVLAMAIAEALFISYPLNSQNGDHLKPSPILAELARCFENIEYLSQTAEEALFFSPNERNDATFITSAAAYLGTKNAAQHFLMDTAGRFMSGAHPRFAYLGRLLAHQYSQYLDSFLAHEPPPFSGRIIEASVSPSQIEDYCHCPYRFFLKHGAKAQRRKDATVKSLDIGNLIHKLLENFVKGGDLSNPEGFAKARIMFELERNQSLAKASPLLIERVKNEAISACIRVADHLEQSSFKPLGTEVKFDSTQKRFKAITLDTKEPIHLIGKIDRVDIAENDSGQKFIRVIDYKTGRSMSFEGKDAYFGKKLQPLLYLAAVKTNYIPAGAFYFKTNLSAADKDSPVHFSGPFIYSDEVVRLMDNNTDSGDCNFIKAKRNKNGALKKNDKAISTALQMEQLCDYSLALAKRAVEQILDGNIEKSPLDKTCDYCDYADVCGFEGTARLCSSMTFYSLIEVYNGVEKISEEDESA